MSNFTCHILIFLSIFCGIYLTRGDECFCATTLDMSCNDTSNDCCSSEDIGTSNCLQCFESLSFKFFSIFILGGVTDYISPCFNDKICQVKMDLNTYVLNGYPTGGCEFCLLYKVSFMNEISRFSFINNQIFKKF